MDGAAADLPWLNYARRGVGRVQAGEEALRDRPTAAEAKEEKGIILGYEPPRSDDDLYSNHYSSAIRKSPFCASMVKK